MHTRVRGHEGDRTRRCRFLGRLGDTWVWNLAGHILPEPTPILISHLLQQVLGCCLRSLALPTWLGNQGRLADRAGKPTLEGVGGARGSGVPGCGFETRLSGSEAARRKGGQGQGSCGAQKKGPCVASVLGAVGPWTSGPEVAVSLARQVWATCMPRGS